MTKNKFYIIIILGLLVSNIILISKMTMPKHGMQPRHVQPKDIIIKKLNFDDVQIKAYDKLIDVHKQTIKEKNDQILTLKKELYSNLKKEQDSNIIDSLSTSIASLQAQIETVHYNHFIDIESLCKPEQKLNFNDLVDGLAKIFSPLPPKK